MIGNMYRFNRDDIQVTGFPEPKTGGMNTYSIPRGIKVVHKATGIVVICEQHRHQHQNREAAFAELDAKLALLEKGVTE